MSPFKTTMYASTRIRCLDIDDKGFCQELFELAQRKFLRQLTEYAEASGELYPRLIFIDCQKDESGVLETLLKGRGMKAQ